MFIMAKRNIELPSADGSQKHKVAKGFIGEIPDWAADTAYFRALVEDGKIAVPDSHKDRDLSAADVPLAEREETPSAEDEKALKEKAPPRKKGN